jgi:hypothetical protein
MIALKLVVTNNDQNNREKAKKTVEQCQENRVVRLEGKNLSHQKEVKFEAKQERENGQGQVTKAPFVCWKVVSFWKVNSGKSEFRESIFRCLVV